MSSLWVPVDTSEPVQNGLRRMLDARSRAIDAGERPAGWKIGWNAPAVRERLGVGSSVIGFLLESGIRPAGQPVPLEGTTKPGAEVELGLRIGEGGTLTALGPAIELIDVHGDFFDVEAALAANVWNRGAVVGETQDWAPGMLDDIRVKVEHNGERFADPARPKDAIGDPEDLVRFVAATLGSLGEDLRAGDVILSGLLVPGAIWTGPGDSVSADYGPLGRLEIAFA
ncbi:MAG: 2-keto-4-pentenoate hydratase [Gaiellaceae bacterium]